ncbi:hypothetical protein WK10_24880 [Burkholderia ubonensis]|nr:hypothetical protein WK10_24880 [Burkholderia ubonensis]
MYVLAFLDRANVGFAKQALHDVVGISDAAFAFGASIFFIAYVLLEIPSNLAMHKVGARAWMCRIMVTWGLVSAATMFVKGPTSFYTLRFILGACEAGFFPGVILYLTYWFPDRTRAKVMGLYMNASRLQQFSCVQTDRMAAALYPALLQPVLPAAGPYEVR